MKTDYQPFNPFLHVFILKTFFVGLMFTLFGSADSVSGTELYRLTDDWLPSAAGNLWGLWLLLVVILHLLEMVFRGKWWGRYTAMAGFTAWAYASWIYVLNQTWFGLVAITGTSLFFYVWYYFSAKEYKYQLQNNQIPPVS